MQGEASVIVLGRPASESARPAGRVFFRSANLVARAGAGLGLRGVLRRRVVWCGVVWSGWFPGAGSGWVGPWRGRLPGGHAGAVAAHGLLWLLGVGGAVLGLLLRVGGVGLLRGVGLVSRVAHGRCLLGAHGLLLVGHGGSHLGVVMWHGHGRLLLLGRHGLMHRGLVEAGSHGLGVVGLLSGHHGRLGACCEAVEPGEGGVLGVGGPVGGGWGGCLGVGVEGERVERAEAADGLGEGVDGFGRLEWLGWVDGGRGVEVAKAVVRDRWCGSRGRRDRGGRHHHHHLGRLGRQLLGGRLRSGRRRRAVLGSTNNNKGIGLLLEGLDGWRRVEGGEVRAAGVEGRRRLLEGVEEVEGLAVGRTRLDRGLGRRRRPGTEQVFLRRGLGRGGVALHLDARHGLGFRLELELEAGLGGARLVGSGQRRLLGRVPTLRRVLVRVTPAPVVRVAPPAVARVAAGAAVAVAAVSREVPSRLTVELVAQPLRRLARLADVRVVAQELQELLRLVPDPLAPVQPLLVVLEVRQLPQTEAVVPRLVHAPLAPVLHQVLAQQQRLEDLPPVPRRRVRRLPNQLEDLPKLLVTKRLARDL
mmetsp:Transcript_20541/g.64599  ORF Transcript_20541/g.64599 Transcript_20541/m.64599 type:complete len:587 (-) Transcript_20541:209-1969(-)